MGFFEVVRVLLGGVPKDSDGRYLPKDIKQLKKLVKNNKVDLGDINTSLITDMSSLFAESTRDNFSGIETWDVSNVTDMSSMFSECSDFNQPLANWDVSNVVNMKSMFEGCSSFNQPLNN